jgi:hypothetical protein
MRKAVVLAAVTLIAACSAHSVPRLVYVEVLPTSVPYYMTLEGAGCVPPVCVGEGCFLKPLFFNI